MNALISLVKRHSLATFFVLAFAISWTLVALIPVSILFSLLALFGPALAAVIVTGITDGRAGVGALLRRVVQWRVRWVWYAAAIGIPFLVAISALLVHSFVTGTPFAMTEQSSIVLLALLAVLVVGEEIGWRGYALPQLQNRYNGLVASLILGVLWACWHLANGTIPGLEIYWTGFPAFLFFVVMQTIVFTWLFNHTRGSVLLAWIMHAAVNVSGSLFFMGDQVTQWWYAGAGFGIVALILILKEGVELARQSTAQVQTETVLQEQSVA